MVTLLVQGRYRSKPAKILILLILLYINGPGPLLLYNKCMNILLAELFKWTCLYFIFGTVHYQFFGNQDGQLPV